MTSNWYTASTYPAIAYAGSEQMRSVLLLKSAYTSCMSQSLCAFGIALGGDIHSITDQR